MSISARLTGKPAGAPTEGCGKSPIHLSGSRAQNTCSAVHHHYLAVALLIIESQNQLPVVLGAAGDAVRTHRTRAKAWSGLSYAREGEREHTDQNHERFQGKQPPDHAIGSRVSSLCCSEVSG